MPSPSRTQGPGESASSHRLSSSHEQRIQQLASRLQASLLDPYDRDPAPARSLQQLEAYDQPSFPSQQQRSRTAGAASATAGLQAAARQHSTVKLSDVFDELIANDQAQRLQQLMQEASFKDRELQRLREALARAQQDSSWAQQKQVAAEDALNKASGTSASLQAELRGLHTTHEQQRQQLHSLSSAKAAAEHAASLAESRAASLDAQLSSKNSELDQVQSQYKRLLDDQQSELERLRQQLQQSSSELSKLQTSSAQKEQGLLQQLQSFNSNLQDIRASHAADKATADQLQKQLEQRERELQDERASKQTAEATAKQLEGLLADSEAERRTLRAKYINLGEHNKAAGAVLCNMLVCMCLQCHAAACLGKRNPTQHMQGTVVRWGGPCGCACLCLESCSSCFSKQLYILRAGLSCMAVGC